MSQVTDEGRRIDVDGVAVSPDHYIGGRRVPSTATFEDRSPLDWDLKLADVARGDAATADAAVSAAVDAFPVWASMTPAERGSIMRRMAHLIDERVPDLARVECLDMAMLLESLQLTAVHIGVTAARNLVPFTAELGGKGPLLVFADADLDAAAKKAAGQFDDSGQVCLAGTRLLVEASARDGFLARFHTNTDAHVLGDSRDPATTVSPMIHPDHLATVAGFVERARAAGDRIVRGGEVWREGGLWYEPTLIEPASNDSEVVQKEVFGPVLTFQTFADEGEAVALANSTRYGLSGIVYTGNRERVGRAVRAGTVWVNTFLVRDRTAPFGGCGISGIGREGGDYALDFHSDLKTLPILDGSVA